MRKKNLNFYSKKKKLLQNFLNVKLIQPSLFLNSNYTRCLWTIKTYFCHCHAISSLRFLQFGLPPWMIFCNLWIQPLKTPNSLLFETLQTTLFRTPKNSQNTLFHTSKFSNPQKPYFRPPENLISAFKKSPKHPISDPQNPISTLKKILKTPYFRPSKHSISDPQKSPQTPCFKPWKPLFQTCKTPCFRPQDNILGPQKIIFQSWNETMFQTQEIPISYPKICISDPKKPCFKRKKILFQTPKNLNPLP